MVFGKKRKTATTTETEQKEPSTEAAALLSDGQSEGAKAGAEKAIADMEKEQAKEQKRNAELEAKYAHITPGSIRLVPRGEEVEGVKSKGRMCDVECIDCGSLRTINIQDAFQVKRCRGCTAEALKAKQAERRAARKAKKDQAAEAENGSAA